jgi:AhpC/TSA family
LTFAEPSGSIPLNTSPNGCWRRARKDDIAMATVLTERGEFDVTTARASGEDLWLSARDAAESTGWVLKPEGLCKDETCVPLPRGREGEFARGEQVNVAALWRHLGQPLVHSDRGPAWVLATSARERAAALRSLEAPDFTLPDPSGRQHSLSDYRGKKVFLVTWASW